jgi:putative peptidoglycan lipid II flippase
MLLGRGLGFLREILIANLLGVSFEADATFLVLTLPDLLIGLLVGESSSIVLVPLFQELKNNKERTQYFYSFFRFFGAIGFLIALVLAYFAGTIIFLLAPGFSPTDIEGVKWGVIFTLVSLPLAAATTVSKSLLQALNLFKTIAFSNSFYNITIIFFLIAMSATTFSLNLIAISVCVAVSLRFLMQYLELINSDYKPLPITFSFLTPKRDLLIAMLFALSGSTILLLMPILTRSFATLAGEGSLSIFNYAYKLVELPMAVLISALSTIFFPRLLPLKENTTEFGVFTKRYTELSLLLALPITGAVFFSSLKLQNINIASTNITSDAMNSIFFLVAILFLSFPLRSLSSLHLVIFSSLKDTKSPLIANVLGIFVCCALCVLNKQSNNLVQMAGVPLVSGYVIIFITELILLRRAHNIMQWKALFGKYPCFVTAISLSLTTLFSLTLQPADLSQLLTSATALFGLTFILSFCLNSKNFIAFFRS